jgi:hypothetical protein
MRTALLCHTPVVYASKAGITVAQPKRVMAGDCLPLIVDHRFAPPMVHSVVVTSRYRVYILSGREFSQLFDVSMRGGLIHVALLPSWTTAIGMAKLTALCC